jgi:hypothetical protein
MQRFAVWPHREGVGQSESPCATLVGGSVKCCTFAGVFLNFSPAEKLEALSLRNVG